ncbi:hypothetical protein Sjap_007984 [Stephania japonica]|uniref:Uncharacterized protein n=1 Tax=Stephania japonica TaxID=461633 RepID=A0AAP0JPG2_9MAGN
MNIYQVYHIKCLCQVVVGDVCWKMHRSTPAAMASSFTLHLQARTFSVDKHR